MMIAQAAKDKKRRAPLKGGKQARDELVKTGAHYAEGVGQLEPRVSYPGFVQV